MIRGESMTPRILGIDISDHSTSLVSYKEEEALRFPTVIGKERMEDRWVTGEEAFEIVLNGKGVKTDKLLTLMLRDGTSTLNGIKYSGMELMKLFLKNVINAGIEKFQSGYPERIVVSLPKVDSEIIEKFFACFQELGYLRNDVHIIGRCESFIYYVMSQSKEVWNNQVGLFSLGDANLTYYEMRVQRNARNTVVYAEREELEEGFNLDLINYAAGAKLADKILTSCAERVMKKKIFSSIMLSGKGFETTEWAASFLKFICSGRRAYADPDLFAKGACFRGVDLAMEKPIFNFTCICEGRLDTGISLNMKKKDKEYSYQLANAGDTWYEIKKNLRLIADDEGGLEIILSPVDIYQKKRTVRIPLDFIPLRPPKTMRIQLEVKCKDDKTMLLRIEDAGFGELFPSSGKSIVEEVELWD